MFQEFPHFQAVRDINPISLLDKFLLFHGIIANKWLFRSSVDGRIDSKKTDGGSKWTEIGWDGEDELRPVWPRGVESRGKPRQESDLLAAPFVNAIFTQASGTCVTLVFSRPKQVYPRLGIVFRLVSILELHLPPGYTLKGA